MDLRIAGRKAIICASSRGLGRACATALAAEGVDVVVNGLDKARLEATAKDIREATKARVTPVVANINTEEGRATLVAACPDADILVNNNAGPPPGKFEDWGRDEWIAALDANMIPAALLIKAVLPGMRQRKFGRIIN